MGELPAGGLSSTPAQLGPCVEEVPERSSIDDSVVDGAADENSAVPKLGELKCGEGAAVSFIADGTIQNKQRFHSPRDVVKHWKQEGERERGSDSACELRAGIIAIDVDCAVSWVGGETASEGREEGEGARERGFEEGEEGSDRKRWRREEEALLDVVAREHGEVGDR